MSAFDAREERHHRLTDKMTREMGGLVYGLLQEPDVIEVMLNPDGEVWVDRLGSRPMERVGTLTSHAAAALMGTVASYLDRTINHQNPILECELPLDGSRFEAVVPPLVKNPTFTLRRRALKVFTLDDYVERGTMTPRQRALIGTAVATRKNILVVGGTSTGKTTLLNAIIAEMSVLTPNHRLVILEDTPEIQPLSQNVVTMRTADGVNMTRLVRVTMRMRPDRIIVGELRGPEALDLFKAWNTGHDGGACSVHANSAHSAFSRVEQLIAEASNGPPHQLIGEAVHYVISIVRDDDGTRRISEVLSCRGYSHGEYQLSNEE